MKTETFKKVIGTVFKVAAVVSLLSTTRIVTVKHTTSDDDKYSTGYYNAVRTIMASDMFDSSKQACITAMKRNADHAYYQAVIEIVKSDMFDSNKISTIKTL